MNDRIRKDASAAEVNLPQFNGAFVPSVINGVEPVVQRFDRDVVSLGI
jgi:hypothetical protein